MFTGLVEALGVVREVERAGAGSNLVVEPRLGFDLRIGVAFDLAIGESMAVDGVCLTCVKREPEEIHFEVGPETLRCTTLGELKPKDRVNLERAVVVGQRLGGHIVQGHVDGVGHIVKRERQGDWEFVWF